MDLWEYPTYFMVLQPNSFMGCYPIILGRPWLATTDAYISYILNNMTISYGVSIKQLTLHPPTNPSINLKILFWPNKEESAAKLIAHQLLTIDHYLSLRYKTRDEEITDFIASSFSNLHIITHQMGLK